VSRSEAAAGGPSSQAADAVAAVALDLPTAAATRALGRRLGELAQPGDLLILSGELGAGKTTLVQGLGEGLGVRGRVSSPTFVIARHHPALGGGPGLLHVDAYRLDGLGQLDALDLDADLEDSVTAVEWGAGLAERLSAERLEVKLERPRGAQAGRAGTGEARRAELRGIGRRWRDLPAQLRAR
jgi:tRNA threonylcarbamoyladenosine biosynthesis protein TsaE